MYNDSLHFSIYASIEVRKLIILNIWLLSRLLIKEAFKLNQILWAKNIFI